MTPSFSGSTKVDCAPAAAAGGPGGPWEGSRPCGSCEDSAPAALSVPVLGPPPVHQQGDGGAGPLPTRAFSFDDFILLPDCSWRAPRQRSVGRKGEEEQTRRKSSWFWAEPSKQLRSVPARLGTHVQPRALGSARLRPRAAARMGTGRLSSGKERTLVQLSLGSWSRPSLRIH